MNHFLAFKAYNFFNMPHLSVSPSSIDTAIEKVGWIHNNLSFTYPFCCESGSPKWQGFGYDLQLEWFSIRHECHPQIRQWMKSSGTFSPPRVLCLFNLPHSFPQEISLILPFCPPFSFGFPPYTALGLSLFGVYFLYAFLYNTFFLSHCFLSACILGR